MSGDMILRALVQDDLPAIRVLAAESEREGFRFLARFLDGLVHGSETLDAPAVRYLACVEDGALVGVGGITPDPYDHQVDVGRVRHVYISPSHRRRGCGRRLVRALEDEARGRFAVLRLRTDTAAAATFYEQLGYTAVGDATASHARTL
jgi:GNAT superfamily N-acetyltransferase